MLKAITSIAKGGTGPTAGLSHLRSLLDIRYLTLLTTISTYALIVLGGTVRATDSGLACPDWPRCHGEWIPPLEQHILIEYSHRLAAVSVGLLIVGMAIAVWLWHRNNRLLLVTATVAVLLLIAQVLVGAATVNQELLASIVAAHLTIALALLAVLTFSTATAFKPLSRYVPGAEQPRAAGEPRLQHSNGPVAATVRRRPTFLIIAVIAALSTLALILIGSYVATSGASLVYPDWPLFNGRLVSAGGGLADLHYAHRLVAAGVGLLVLLAAVQAWRSQRQAVLRAAVSFALALYVAQVFIGASNIWLELATSVQIAHLALASAIWGMLVLAAAWSYLERRAV